jgi:hypothetical protein
VINDGIKPTITLKIMPEEKITSSRRVKDKLPFVDDCWPHKTGTHTRTSEIGTKTSIKKENKSNCQQFVVAKKAININFNAKILVPGRPKVTSSAAQENLANEGEDHHTPLTRKSEREEYLL